MIAVTVALLMLAPAPTTNRCVVSGTVKNLAAVSIEGYEAPHAKLFDVTLHDASVEAIVGDDAIASVGGAGALSYRGTVMREALPLRVKRTTRVLALTLSPKTPLVVQRVVGAQVELVARPNEDVTIGPFKVACGALTLGDAAPEEQAIVQRPPESRRLTATGDTLVLRTKRAADAPTVTVTLARGAAFLLERVSVRGDVEVRTRWSDGTVLHGFVAPEAVMPMQLDYIDAAGLLHGMCGFGVSDTYLGPATLKAGGQLFDKAEGGTLWAVARRDTTIEVIGSGGVVEVTFVPGIVQSPGCVRTETAWTDADKLVYPRDP